MPLLLLLAMVVGSVIAGCAQDLATMIVGRALEGTAIGTVPIAISITRDLLPPDRRRGAIALISASLGFGAAIGLPGATALVDAFGFRVLFFAAAVLGVVIAILVAIVVPAEKRGAEGSFDWLGAVLLALGITGVLLVLAQGHQWGWAASAATGGSGLAGVVVLVAFALWELRGPDALLDLRVAAGRTVLLTNLASIVLGFALAVCTVAFPEAMEVPRALGGSGVTALAASIGMMPSGSSWLSSPRSRRR